ncbi:hypothetical protein EC912_104173 [Luteibacter rhizovicinus]|uniref:Uncharacterized protein n=2 Tax=Luteibacter rhizovicinus TaxID=242606 RepID=A0A4R3YMW2_9GAMM|nr:hypothetical protein EC912_104173 [Luteibacter rhizovicinus]
MNALVYRRRLRERPRDRLLRVMAMVGTLVIHLVFLFGMILGPAYDVLPPLPDQDSEAALEVRLIDKPPPPVPPVRGTPSKAPVEKSRRANANATASKASRDTRAAAVATNARSAIPAIAVPAAVPPVVKPNMKVVAPMPSIEATPERPVVQSKAPPPQPDLEKVPIPEQAPPDLAMDQPQPKVVPPRFQPEPVRKAQIEGTVAMPPPASLAIPPTPASQPDVRPTPPQIVADSAAKVPTTSMTLATVPRPEVETTAAPPTPQEEPLPTVAAEPTAPALDLKVDARSVPPKVSPDNIRAPSVDTTAELAAIPLPDAVPRPAIGAPVSTADKPAVQAPEVAPGDVQRPLAGIDTTAAKPGEAPGDIASGESTAQTRNEQGKAAGEHAAATTEGAPGAPGESVAAASGSNTPGAVAETGKPGAANGADTGTKTTGANGTSQRDDGVAGGQGDKRGAVGTYIQVRPHGNTDVMTRGRVHVDYQATRFDGAWTPKGESSVDTAVRHGVEGSTVKSAISLPRGVRVDCSGGPGTPNPAMKAISLLSFGCHGDKPGEAVAQDALAKNQTMAPSKPLAADLPPANAATTAAPAVVLDNSALCATARVSGGPLPPGCAADVQIARPAPKPGDSWVPASDQFK